VADQLTETARQVRLDDSRGHEPPVHELVRRWHDPRVGLTYRTRCQHVLTKAEGAILTTREATCGPCKRGGR
jgi:hypothetical protein